MAITEITYNDKSDINTTSTPEVNKITASNINEIKSVVNTNANLQIDLYCFIIGLYINEVEKGNIKFDSSVKIHDDENADEFIKKSYGQ